VRAIGTMPSCGFVVMRSRSGVGTRGTTGGVGVRPTLVGVGARPTLGGVGVRAMAGGVSARCEAVVARPEPGVAVRAMFGVFVDVRAVAGVGVGVRDTAGAGVGVREIVGGVGARGTAGPSAVRARLIGWRSPVGRRVAEYSPEGGLMGLLSSVTAASPRAS
jgi:hypothetical protein